MQNFDPKKTAEYILAGLPKRTATVLEKRFGIGKAKKRSTLEAIGTTYGITRERVRQIERDGVLRIKKSPRFVELMSVFALFTDGITQRGGLVAEHDLVRVFDADGSSQNAVRFLLTLAPGLMYRSESDVLHARWGMSDTDMDAVEHSLENIASTLLQKIETVSYEELSFLIADILQREHIADAKDLYPSYLAVSKCIDKNQYDGWGHTSSPLVRPRGVRDLAYLVFQKEGAPMHFSKAAEHIRVIAAPRRVHAQTVHNELIKDNRFVLVGRGTYGLVEWGYEAGTVRDIIARVLVVGPQSREAIVAAVLTKRRVKENTVLINLQNRTFFQKLADGTYSNVV